MEEGIIKTKDHFHIKKNSQSGLNSLVFPKENYTELADGLFLETARIGNESLQEVCIPNNVQVIGNKCFKNCTELEKITIPNSVTKMGKECFRGCKKIRKVNLPENIKILPEYFLGWCYSLSDVNIPDNVTTILDGCFSNCTNLKSITLPNTVSKIGEAVFCNCTSLEDVTFNSNNIDCICDEMFLDCENLEHLKLPSSIEKIGKKAFSGCSKLENINLPQALKVIEDNAFEECLSLTEVTIPPTVTHIGEGAFSNCSNLETVSILPKTSSSDEPIMIHDGAFSDCSNIKNLSLPKNAFDNENAFDFSSLPKLKSINYNNSNILNLSEDEVFSNLLYNGKLIYIEYMNKFGERTSKVLEDISSNKRDIRSIELTRQFNKLRSHDIFQNNFKFDTDENRLCLNMLSVMNYTACEKLLSLLNDIEQTKKDNIGKKEIQKALNGNVKLKSNHQLKHRHKSKIKEADNKAKKSLFNRIKNIIKRLFTRHHKNNPTDTKYIQMATVVDFIEILFSSPKILGNTTKKDFTKFFSDNMKDIVEINNVTTLENLAEIQRNFQNYIKSPILRSKIQSGKLTLQDALQCKRLYVNIAGTEEFTSAEKKENMYEHGNDIKVVTDDIEL